MTEEELQAIRERANKATAGATPEWYVDDEYANLVVREAWNCDLIAQGIPNKADAEFIAAARQDVPKLLAEIERLRELAKEILSEYDDVERHHLGNFARSYSSDIKFHEKIIADYIREIVGGGAND